MVFRWSSAVTIGIIFIFVFGCSGGNPVDTPVDTTGGTVTQQASADDGHVLWGLWEFELDPATETVEAIPLRSASFNANVVKFLQPPSSPIHLLTVTLEQGSDIATGFWVLDVTIRHPFLSYAKFRGFDVRGILMTEGGSVGIYDPTINYRSSGGTRLTNADGYTRWWNPQEFTTYGTILGYTEGAKVIPGDFADATLNPYKLFTDALDETAPLVSMDPEMRATFATMPGVNTRRYKIQFDIDGGPPPLRFKYAIDASWSLPDPAYEPDYPVEAYDRSANCQEPYLLNVPVFEEIPYYENVTTYGGDAVFLLTIGDWQTEESGGPGAVLGQLKHIWVESPTLIDAPIDVMPSAEFVNSSHETQGTFRVTVPDCSPSGVIGQQFLITAESYSPSTYMPQIQGDPYMFDWPEEALASYTIVDVPIYHDGPIEPLDAMMICFSDWATIAGPCFQDSGCAVFCANMITWDIEGPANDNLLVKFWSGHHDPIPNYGTSEFGQLVNDLGYDFEEDNEPLFDAANCRLIIVNFCGASSGGDFAPFTDDEIADMKAFMAEGGILAMMTEAETWVVPEWVNTFLDQMGMDITYGGPAEPDGGFMYTSNITEHELTLGMDDFCYVTTGHYLIESDDVISLVRSEYDQHLVVLAPVNTN